MASARSPRGRGAASPSGRRDSSPQHLAERVRELEAAEREARKAQTKEQRQRQRELADAKKRIAKELQAASRLMQKGEREAGRLSTKAEQVEKQAEQAKAKVSRQQAVAEEGLARMHAKRHGIESTLQEKMSVIGEARGRLAHAAFAAKMIEQGVIVPVEGTSELGSRSRGVVSPSRSGGQDPWPETLSMQGRDSDRCAHLEAENQRLQESLAAALAELDATRAELEGLRRATTAEAVGAAACAATLSAAARGAVRSAGISTRRCASPAGGVVARPLNSPRALSPQPASTGGSQGLAPLWPSGAPLQRLGFLTPRAPTEPVVAAAALTPRMTPPMEPIIASLTPRMTPPKAPQSPRFSADMVPPLLMKMRNFSLPPNDFGTKLAAMTGMPAEPVAIKHVPAEPVASPPVVKHVPAEPVSAPVARHVAL